MSKQKVVIIVINYGTPDFVWELTQNFLGSMPNAFQKRIDWVVVDTFDENKAGELITDSSIEKYYTNKKGNHFYNFKIPNRGFASNVNKAFEIFQKEHSDSKLGSNDLVLLLNPDTTLYWVNLEKAIRFMNSTPKASATGLALTSPKGQLEKWGHSLTFPSLKLFFGHKRFSQPSSSDEPVEVAWVSGGALLVKYEWWEKLGGFDPNFFMYFEDVDFCRRIADAGGKIFFLPQATVVHRRGGSNISIYRRKKHFYSAEARYFYLYESPREYLLLRMMRFPYKIMYFLRCYLAPSFWKNRFKDARKSLSCERNSGFPRFCAFKISFMSIPFLKEIWLTTILLNFIILGGAIWAKYYLSSPLVLHYNAYLGIDLYGDTRSLLMFPLITFLVSLFNFVLGIILFFSKRYTPFVIIPAGSSLAFQMGIIIALLNLLMINS